MSCPVFVCLPTVICGDVIIRRYNVSHISSYGYAYQSKRRTVLRIHGDPEKTFWSIDATPEDIDKLINEALDAVYHIGGTGADWPSDPMDRGEYLSRSVGVRE